MKVGDIGVLLIFNIVNPSDTIVNLIGATTVSLCIYKGNTATSYPMVIYNATAGQVAYTVTSGILSTTGVYKFEVHVGFAGGSEFTSSRTFDVVQPTLW